MAGHVFISYSRRDGTYVRRLVDHLRSAGVEVWLDGDGIDYGDRWATVISERVDTSAVFVPVMSPASEGSEWVERELVRAQDGGRPIMPILLSGRPFFRLNATQFEDVTGDRMPQDRFVAKLRTLAPAADSAPQVPARPAPAVTPRRSRPSTPTTTAAPTAGRLGARLVCGLALALNLAAAIGLGVGHIPVGLSTAWLGAVLLGGTILALTGLRHFDHVFPGVWAVALGLVILLVTIVPPAPWPAPTSTGDIIARVIGGLVALLGLVSVWAEGLPLWVVFDGDDLIGLCLGGISVAAAVAVFMPRGTTEATVLVLFGMVLTVNLRATGRTRLLVGSAALVAAAGLLTDLLIGGWPGLSVLWPGIGTTLLATAAITRMITAPLGSGRSDPSQPSR
ncbi:hypothetical protein F4553_003425 [Allocatelliglobosispora scoriae]|uniref:TIR domain-containing protein n=1 Tax=Allocatelliglobosispora scoriae TaxID=643052 RepID=A0A841BRN3_9ACTN|nr:toll/interleukin-1 receptor domain-containing protein [Allocatelliglobosispora scoriae]MBB5870046.1 hypothetical protein [Allocatelliglobosispora scoriae]